MHPSKIQPEGLYGTILHNNTDQEIFLSCDDLPLKEIIPKSKYKEALDIFFKISQDAINFRKEPPKILFIFASLHAGKAQNPATCTEQNLTINDNQYISYLAWTTIHQNIENPEETLSVLEYDSELGYQRILS